MTIVHKKQKKSFYKREKKNTISVKTFLKEKKKIQPNKVITDLSCHINLRLIIGAYIHNQSCHINLRLIFVAYIHT